MKKEESESAAQTMLNWIRELHVVENGMRTDAEVEAVVAGVSKGSVYPLQCILGRPVRRVLSKKIVREFAELLAHRLYPDGEYTIEDMSCECRDDAVRFQIALHLASS